MANILEFQDKKNKRQKVLISTLLTVALYLLVGRNVANLPTEALVVARWLGSALEVILIWWVYEFDVRLGEIIPLFAPVLSFVYIGYSVLESGLVLVWWAGVLIFGLLYYVLMLVMNVINVSTVRVVPLKRAALSSLFFLAMIMFSVYGLATHNSGWGGDWLQLAIFIAMVSLFGYSFLSLSVNESAWLEGIVFALVVAKVFVLVNFMPASLVMSVLAAVGWSFIFLGVLQHHLNKELTSPVIREYVLLSSVLLLAFLFV